MKSWTVNTENIISKDFDTLTLNIYDTKSQKIQALRRTDKTTQIYVCGITPYDSAHLGHAFTYLAFDLMIRAMNFIGMKTNYVQNVTDIDDPLFERARKSGVEWQQIVHSQLDIYRADMSKLNILPPTEFVGVMENMELIIDGIGKSIAGKSTYKIDTEHYFETQKNSRSKLVENFSREELIVLAKERGCDTERSGKHDPLDPILWKASKADEPSWSESFGTGRPGWHIQCICLANKFALLPLDIQGGGKDLIFPHHAMSEEQSESLGFGELALNYCHVGMVSYQGSKMSKSKGNLVFVHELLNQGISPMVIRLALMLHHWQDDWEFDSDIIEQATKIYLNLSQNLGAKYMSKADVETIVNLCLNNLDIPKVISFLLELKPIAHSDDGLAIDSVLQSLLGLKLGSAI